MVDIYMYIDIYIYVCLQTYIRCLTKRKPPTFILLECFQLQVNFLPTIVDTYIYIYIYIYIYLYMYVYINIYKTLDKKETSNFPIVRMPSITSNIHHFL